MILVHLFYYNERIIGYFNNKAGCNFIHRKYSLGTITYYMILYFKIVMYLYGVRHFVYSRLSNTILILYF